MGFNFKAVAKESTTFSEIMVGREKVDMADICNLYPNGVTVMEFDIVAARNEKGETGEFCVCAFKEDEKACFFGGIVLTKICKSWLKGFASVKECSEALKAEGGVKMKFKRERTKDNKKDVTTVEILD